ncbi:MAG TPA: hypothetical protein VMS81_01780 [Methanomicrobiales archaeon]|jgi:hypothetical protein|nr:hypothetical protein [Methanomicrobiales archaeon]
MQAGEILGGSIAVFIIVLIGLFVLPLAEALTGQSMLLVTVPIAIAAALWFILSLRRLVGGKAKDTLRLRIQATRAGIIFIAALFWSVVLVLPVRWEVLKVYSSLPLEAKFLFWFGLDSLIAIRVYTSLLTHRPSEEEEPILPIEGLRIVEMKK